MVEGKIAHAVMLANVFGQTRIVRDYIASLERDRIAENERRRLIMNLAYPRNSASALASFDELGGNNGKD